MLTNPINLMNLINTVSPPGWTPPCKTPHLKKNDDDENNQVKLTWLTISSLYWSFEQFFSHKTLSFKHTTISLDVFKGRLLVWESFAKISRKLKVNHQINNFRFVTCLPTFPLNLSQVTTCFAIFFKKFSELFFSKKKEKKSYLTFFRESERARESLFRKRTNNRPDD